MDINLIRTVRHTKCSNWKQIAKNMKFKGKHQDLQKHFDKFFVRGQIGQLVIKMILWESLMQDEQNHCWWNDVSFSMKFKLQILLDAFRWVDMHVDCGNPCTLTNLLMQYIQREKNSCAFTFAPITKDAVKAGDSKAEDMISNNIIDLKEPLNTAAVGGSLELDQNGCEVERESSVEDVTLTIPPLKVHLVQASDGTIKLKAQKCKKKKKKRQKPMCGQVQDNLQVVHEQPIRIDEPFDIRVRTKPVQILDVRVVCDSYDSSKVFLPEDEETISSGEESDSSESEEPCDNNEELVSVRDGEHSSSPWKRFVRGEDCDDARSPDYSTGDRCRPYSMPPQNGVKNLENESLPHLGRKRSRSYVGDANDFPDNQFPEVKKIKTMNCVTLSDLDSSPSPELCVKHHTDVQNSVEAAECSQSLFNAFSHVSGELYKKQTLNEENATTSEALHYGEKGTSTTPPQLYQSVVTNRTTKERNNKLFALSKSEKSFDSRRSIFRLDDNMLELSKEYKGNKTLRHCSELEIDQRDNLETEFMHPSMLNYHEDDPQEEFVETTCQRRHISSQSTTKFISKLAHPQDDEQYLSTSSSSAPSSVPSPPVSSPPAKLCKTARASLDSSMTKKAKDALDGDYWKPLELSDDRSTRRRRSTATNSYTGDGLVQTPTHSSENRRFCRGISASSKNETITEKMARGLDSCYHSTNSSPPPPSCMDRDESLDRILGHDSGSEDSEINGLSNDEQTYEEFERELREMTHIADIKTFIENEFELQKEFQLELEHKRRAKKSTAPFTASNHFRWYFAKQKQVDTEKNNKNVCRTQMEQSEVLESNDPDVLKLAKTSCVNERCEASCISDGLNNYEDLMCSGNSADVISGGDVATSKEDDYVDSDCSYVDMWTEKGDLIRRRKSMYIPHFREKAKDSIQFPLESVTPFRNKQNIKISRNLKSEMRDEKDADQEETKSDPFSYAKPKLNSMLMIDIDRNDYLLSEQTKDWNDSDGNQEYQEDKKRGRRFKKATEKKKQLGTLQGTSYNSSDEEQHLAIKFQQKKKKKRARKDATATSKVESWMEGTRPQHEMTSNYTHDDIITHKRENHENGNAASSEEEQDDSHHEEEYFTTFNLAETEHLNDVEKQIYERHNRDDQNSDKRTHVVPDMIKQQVYDVLQESLEAHGFEFGKRNKSIDWKKMLAYIHSALDVLVKHREPEILPHSFAEIGNHDKLRSPNDLYRKLYFSLKESGEKGLDTSFAESVLLCLQTVDTPPQTNSNDVEVCAAKIRKILHARGINHKPVSFKELFKTQLRSVMQQPLKSKDKQDSNLEEIGHLHEMGTSGSRDEILKRTKMKCAKDAMEKNIDECLSEFKEDEVNKEESLVLSEEEGTIEHTEKKKRKKRKKAQTKKERRIAQINRKRDKLEKDDEKALEEIKKILGEDGLEKQKIVNAPRFAYMPWTFGNPTMRGRHEERDVLAYYPQRNDYELEYFNDAESLIARTLINDLPADKRNDPVLQMENFIKFVKAQYYNRIAEYRLSVNRAIELHQKNKEYLAFVKNKSSDRRKPSEILDSRPKQEQIIERIQQCTLPTEIENLKKKQIVVNTLLEKIKKLQDMQREGIKDLDENYRREEAAQAAGAEKKSSKKKKKKGKFTATKHRHAEWNRLKKSIARNDLQR